MGAPDGLRALRRNMEPDLTYEGTFIFVAATTARLPSTRLSCSVPSSPSRFPISERRDMIATNRSQQYTPLPASEPLIHRQRSFGTGQTKESAGSRFIKAFLLGVSLWLILGMISRSVIGWRPYWHVSTSGRCSAREKQY